MISQVPVVITYVYYICLCQPRSSPKLYLRLHWRTAHRQESLGMSHLTLLVGLRLMSPWHQPQQQKEPWVLSLNWKHAQVKAGLGNMKVNMFRTHCCCQTIFNLQHKFIGSLSTGEPDGPGNWQLVMSSAAFQVSVTHLNGAQLIADHPILLEISATWTRPWIPS